MGSLAKEYSTQKINGRVYTPPEIVARVLDAAGYCGANICGARILDPACGDGEFLVEVVRRVIAATPRRDLPVALLAVHGWDNDAEAVTICRDRLDEIVAPLGIRIDWNVRVANSLDAYADNSLFAKREEPFDFVVGNPPYVRIQHLSEQDRALVQSRFRFCANGSTDLYIAFFELALSLLTQGGVLAFITPNTFFHTATGRTLRRHLASQHLLRHVVNFGHRQVFPNATTYAAITIASNQPAASFEYVDATSTIERSQRIAAENLATQNIWRFGCEDQVAQSSRFRPLKEIAQIRVGLATLADSVYVVQSQSSKDDIVQVRTKHFGDLSIERELLRPIIKGSKVKAGRPCYEGALIVFPYCLEQDRPMLIAEDELAARFPLGHAYLSQARPLLERRDNGRPNAAGWYAFGRTQALASGFGEKIICPPMANTPNFAVCKMAETTVYSGYFLKYEGDLDALAAQLNSPRMHEFVQSGGRDYQGGWKGYSKASIQDFMIDISQL